jgi:hypothetical protein
MSKLISSVIFMNRNLFIVTCTLIVLEAVGQSDSSGIFLSIADYQRNQLTLPVSCKSKKNAIKLHKYIAKAFITTRFEGKRYKYNKAAIFGYKDCSKKAFRFFLDDAYEITNTDGFWLYRQIVESDDWDDPHLYSIYYFSKDPSSIIYSLTKHNLKLIFREKLQFVETLDSLFRSDNELHSFNWAKKKYKIIEAFLDE